MEIEGKLQIDLYRQDDGIREVTIHSSRPLQAVKIFQGKPVKDVLQTLPLLYHVCGVAQANAAVKACQQAMDIFVDDSTAAAREMLVWMETAREHLWRIMMDWSAKLGEAKDTIRLVQLQSYLPELKKSLFADENGFYLASKVKVKIKAVQEIIRNLQQLLFDVVSAMPLDKWLAIDNIRDLETWMANSNTVASRMLQHIGTVRNLAGNPPLACLPSLEEVDLHRMLTQGDADTFVAQPEWQGQACETSVLCRQQHHPLIASQLPVNPLLARMLARLVELASIPQRLEQLLTQVLSASPNQVPYRESRQSGTGLAQVEAARGRLVHRVELHEGIVHRYQILAPTEWNFHPAGVAAQLLKLLPADDDVMFRQQADMLISTIDPCVSYEMSVH